MSMMGEMCDFYGRDFLVTGDVLIPRPETEQMIDAALDLMGISYLPGVKPSASKFSENELSDGLKILEVGTGSGCVATTLALELKKTGVKFEESAVDISEKALEVARENARRYGVLTEVEFLRSDLTEAVQGSQKEWGFDIILANLPYVDESWEWVDKKTLSKEPSLALYAGDGGCEVIFRLITEATERKLGKWLILEADPCQHERIREFAEKKGIVLERIMGFQMVFRVKFGE